MFAESGTYANPTGTVLQWLGLVQNHTIEDLRASMQIRTEGAGTRNISQTVYTTNDYNGTITYYPQDFRMLGFALGSFFSTSGPNCSHIVTETNSDTGNAFTSGTKAPFISFTIQDSKKSPTTNKHFIRTLNGATINSLNVSWAQGEPLTCEVNYIAQQLIRSSGAAAAVTADTLRPLLWKDVKVHIPSGTTYPTTAGTFAINNNLEGRHVTNGSQEIDLPIPLNRDYSVSLTMDTADDTTNTLYDYFQFGSSFNMMLEIDGTTTAVGSRSTYIVFSGCNLVTSSQPSPMTGINEDTFTVIPTTCNAKSYDRIGTIGKWGGW